MAPKRKLESIVSGASTSPSAAKKLATQNDHSELPVTEQNMSARSAGKQPTKLDDVSASVNAESDIRKDPYEAHVEAAAEQYIDDQAKEGSATESGDEGRGEDGSVAKNSEPASVERNSSITPARAEGSSGSRVDRGSSMFTLSEEQLEDIVRSEQWYSGEQLARIHDFLFTTKPANHIFSLLRVPNTLCWEKTKNGVATASNIMHARGASTPAIIWIIGAVRKVWFFNSSSEPVSRPAITLKPMIPEMLQAAKRLLSNNPAYPTPSGEDEYTDIRASTFCTSRVRGMRATQPTDFMSVFDATDLYHAHMRRIEASQIKEGDVVLLEATVSRYRDGGGRQSTGPTVWKKTFDMKRVALVCRADDRPAEDEDEIPVAAMI